MRISSGSSDFSRRSQVLDMLYKTYHGFSGFLKPSGLRDWRARLEKRQGIYSLYSKIRNWLIVWETGWASQKFSSVSMRLDANSDARRSQHLLQKVRSLQRNVDLCWSQPCPSSSPHSFPERRNLQFRHWTARSKSFTYWIKECQ